MTLREGVIKFDLAFRPGPAPAAELLQELDGWRQVFRRLGLLGQDPARYEGLGFGNLSRRLPSEEATGTFIISGTQTGAREHLTPADYVTVTACDPACNRVTASGPVRPSSESLSHAILYQADPRIAWVMHLHSPEIFGAAARLGLPVTDPAAAYGTPAMAAEIQRVHGTLGASGVLVMGGHEDGIIAFGPTADGTGGLTVRTLAAALA